MAIKNLEKADWGDYLNQLSRQLPIQLAEIRVESLLLGSQIEAAWLLIFGISYDHKDDILIISLDGSLDGLEHIIHRPRIIFIDESEGLVTSLETVDADGVRHLVQLRQPHTVSAQEVLFDAVDEAGAESSSE